jgi:hypothetical protein
MELSLNPTYERFRYYRGESQFEITLRLIQELLQERLCDGYLKIRVFGSNSKLVRLGFAVFDRNGYRLYFQLYPNFRNYRQDLDLESEVSSIEEIISNLSRGCLMGVIR